MATTKYGRSPWLDRFPKSRVPAYPRYGGEATVDVLIIGGGLTGCAAAYALAASGIKPLLLEASHIGRGATSASSGWVNDDPGVSFAAIEKAHGRRAARYAWQAWRRSALDFGALVRRLELKCHFEPRPTATVAVTPSQAADLKREVAARRDAAIDVAGMTARAVHGEIGIEATVAVRSKDGATLDPYRACLGLAAAAAARGARIFERSAIRRVRFDRKKAFLQADGGAITAGRVIVATGAPTPLYRSLMRHFWYRTRYAAVTDPIPARVRRRLGDRRSVVRDSALPPHVVRWIDDERLLVAGGDRDAPPERQRAKHVVANANELMYELSLLYPDISGTPIAYGWDIPYARTADGLPYIGPHRNFPFHLFAWGDSGQGVTGAYLASRVLLRHVSGDLDRGDDVFAFAR